MPRRTGFSTASGHACIDDGTLITEALQHCTGIGPIRLAQLHAAGLRTWSDILRCEAQSAFHWQEQLAKEVRQCAQALAANDVRFFVERLAPQDKWRILGHFFEQTTFFDIETTGLDYDATITVIICWHKGRLHTFIEHENLDDFLDLLDDITLLASFNGSSFDVPRVLESFHLPELPCPHLDLRWVGYHQGYSGGLKEIAASMRIERPDDLQFVNGDDAVRLWSMWLRHRNANSRQMLIRYCAADVLLLTAVAERLAGRKPQLIGSAFWKHLPDRVSFRVQSTPPATTSPNVDHPPQHGKPPQPSGNFLQRIRGQRDLLSRLSKRRK
ncbi:MAG: ribonuclease H-like domain-containing protein [Pirellulales bacterium]|nr:ribonuclease H-like domain-containing protein [Pirellulales bacterium]